mmetsp:Transcript_27429/g.45358  ORF Transcript_27429/g.45358 Transcript_27429/m.45358 type:complete len:299 (+) Transcript_27429:1651-2547(+)
MEGPAGPHGLPHWRAQRQGESCDQPHRLLRPRRELRRAGLWHRCGGPAPHQLRESGAHAPALLRPRRPAGPRAPLWNGVWQALRVCRHELLDRVHWAVQTEGHHCGRRRWGAPVPDHPLRPAGADVRGPAAGSHRAGHGQRALWPTGHGQGGGRGSHGQGLDLLFPPVCPWVCPWVPPAKRVPPGPCEARPQRPQQPLGCEYDLLRHRGRGDAQARHSLRAQPPSRECRRAGGVRSECRNGECTGNRSKDGRWRSWRVFAGFSLPSFGSRKGMLWKNDAHTRTAAIERASTEVVGYIM